MATYGKTPKPKAPSTVVVVPPSMFADDWECKPTSEVAIGLRLLSLKDLDIARAQAAEEACELYDDHKGGCTDEEARVDHFNDTLVRLAVARSVCNPNDVAQPYWEAADITVRIALTSEGARFLWDALIRNEKGHGVGYAPVGPSEIAHLARLLQRGAALRALTPERQSEVGKLLAYCIEQLAPFDAGAETPEEDDGDKGEWTAVRFASATP